MTTWASPAKINWYLRVLGRRPDGYHDIETVFQSLDLHDELEFHPVPGGECTITGMPGDVPLERNLVWRAWEALRRRWPERVGGVDVVVRKRIPMGGGLGGGSSNAATALRAVVRTFDLRVAEADLHAIAVSLGSDVPFFLVGGCAVGRGRGETLEPVEPMPPLELVLLFPEESVSTAEAYRVLGGMERPGPVCQVADFLQALRSGDPERIAASVHNDFERVVADRPWYRHARDVLERAGCSRAFLTGSGSTVVGVPRKEKTAREIAIIVQESNGARVVVATSGTPAVS